MSLPANPDRNSAPQPYVLDVGMQTDVGCVRDHNEDCVSIVRDLGNGEGERALLVVADGMGGHNAGEIASSISVALIAAAFPQMRTQPAERLKLAFERANEAVHKQSLETPEMSGMGTTCTALLLQDGYGYSAHVGDSHLYLVRAGGIYLMNEDHSAVMEMVNAGQITLQQARHHPDRNVITRSLGVREFVEVSTWKQPLPLLLGDRFLLCSDGLYDKIEDEEICGLVCRLSPDTACQQLVDIARQRGGDDNISVAVVSLRPAASQGESFAPTEL